MKVYADRSTDDNRNEICAGCGAVSTPTQAIRNNAIVTLPGTQPWVGVGSPDLAKQTTSVPDDGHPNVEDMVAHPVCDLCHKDPTHRTKDPLKVHFFAREDRRVGVFGARAQILREDPE